MESSDARSSRISSYPSRKRKPSPEQNSSLDRQEIGAETVHLGLESSGTDSSQLLRQLESKDRELEARISNMYTEFQTMQSVNQDLKSQVKDLQVQYERLLSRNRELESRINRFEQQPHHTEMMNQDVSSQASNCEQHSQEVEPESLALDQLVKDFEVRCDLVESNNQGVTERLDSCEQRVSKMRQKNESFENQLTSLQQRLKSFEIDEKNTQHNGAVSIQQLVENGTHQNLFKTVNAELIDNMNTPKEPVHDNNDGCSLIEETLCKPYENQIRLLTDEIQYGIFDVCDKYNVILIKERDKLKLFDHQKQIDERPWGELGHTNFATCIHWCAFLDSFLILYRFKLHVLSLRRNQETSQMEFDRFTHINSIRVYSLDYHPTNRSNKGKELLRFLTTSPKLPGYLFLNRGYRRIELVNTNSWKVVRGWSKQDLDYEEAHEIRLITCSYDGSYLAMNIRWNDRVRFIDLRKNDEQMTLIKSIRMPNDSASLSHRRQLPFDQEKWLAIDEKNQCFMVSTNPNDEKIILMRTEHIQAIENVTVHFRFVRNDQYLLVGSVMGNCTQKQGVFSFYKFSA